MTNLGVNGSLTVVRVKGSVEQLLAGPRRESHSGAAKRQHGEQAAEELLAAGLDRLGLGFRTWSGDRKMKYQYLRTDPSMLRKTK